MVRHACKFFKGDEERRAENMWCFIVSNSDPEVLNGSIFLLLKMNFVFFGLKNTKNII